MTKQSSFYSQHRYTYISIVLHWLSALVIIGLLAVGKYMTSLPETDSLRFDLTQWHKSFGLTVLALSIARVLWRVTHKPPKLSPTMPGWEKFVAGLTHLAFYLLILFLPITGWLMVSASPLNISTIFFNILPVPHLPVVSTAANKAELAHTFETLHEYASGILIVLLLLHIGAALRHQFMLRDGLLSRMTPNFGDPGVQDGSRLALGALFVLLLGGWLAVTASKSATTAGNPAAGVTAETEGASPDDTPDSGGWLPAEVTYTMIVMGDEIKGNFADAKVKSKIDTEDFPASALTAIVQTASGSTGSPKIDDSLPGADWFNVSVFPEASFTSSQFNEVSPEQVVVSGQLTIRDVSKDISFTINIDQDANTASGGFAINRLDYDLGASEQPDDSNAAFNVLIDFSFPLQP